ncbi:MAG: DNA methylase [bacterium]|nr:DNA methylase [bacterium]
MAESPAHKFGQLIGNLLEEIMQPLFTKFCKTHTLYLDFQGKERSARKGKKITWKDKYGNLHDLDYVIEKGGTDNERGHPIAFIEVAWRRYTKHSRNKAQEIQGAVLPIADKYEWNNPFLGTVLAGTFTRNSIEQMESVGFHVLYFPYSTIVKSFAAIDVHVEFDEKTPDTEFKRCVEVLETLDKKKLNKVKKKLITLNKTPIDSFLGALQYKIEKLVERIIVIPLYGKETTFLTIQDAISFISEYNNGKGDGHFRKYEIIIDYSNSDKITGSFVSKRKAIDFLEFILAQ